jgi:hypothetical protein
MTGSLKTLLPLMAVFGLVIYGTSQLASQVPDLQGELLPQNLIPQNLNLLPYAA